MIVIIDYKAGNISSIQNAIIRLGYNAILSSDVNTIKNASKVILPGVGQAKTAMESLKNSNLKSVIKKLKQPVLGICLGMQLMCNSSEEGNIEGLGIFDTKVKLFPPKEKVPHMGWNDITPKKGKLIRQTKIPTTVYFAHSYYAEINETTTSICNYIVPFSASLEKNNFYGTQFHPEKSSAIGMQILTNFLKL